MEENRSPFQSGWGSSLAQEVLAGGGEMGALMRRIDWSKTDLGPVEIWPQSLRTAVSICLDSRFPILIWWGPELVMLYNDAYRPILGTTKHPGAMGQRGRECWPEIWSIIGPMLEGVVSRGEATWSNDQMLPLYRSGYVEECYFTFSYSPIRDESRGVGGVFTAVTETTGRVLAERRLQTLRELGARTADAKTVEEASQAALAVLADNPDDLPFALLYLLDGEGRAATLAGVAGVEPGQPASPAWIDLASSGSQEPVWPLVRVIETGQPEQVEELAGRLVVVPPGPWPERPTVALILPIASTSQARPIGCLVAGVSARRALDDDYRNFLRLVAGAVATALTSAQAHEAERRRAEALAELDRAKTAFFSNISHEFRTPLTLMLGPLQDLFEGRLGPLGPGQREEIELVQRNGLRLLRLVNTLLDFSRIESQRVRAVYEPVDLAALTADLASVFRSAIERAGLRLVVDCPHLPEPVYVDREMWEKIVLNLLSNAFKFTFEGEIEVRLRLQANQVVLEVRDTGTGIPGAELPFIFSRFHRVRDTAARSHEGSGIGLALVQELVRLHGGRIEVSSRPGEGSLFTVSIPRGAAHLPADQLGPARPQTGLITTAAPYVEEASRWLPDQVPGAREDELPVPPGPQSGSPASRGLLPAHILLADDNADMRAYLKRLLEEEWQVTAVADGAAALAAARARPPDLVLADVMMPGLDGFELLQALRADRRTQAVPVILLSARAGEEAQVEGLEAGAADYMIKPFSARELLARISARLELRRAQQAAERAAERVVRLQKITAALSQALTPNQVADVIISQALPALDAAAGWVHWLTPDGQELEMLASTGYPVDLVERWRRFPATAGVPSAEACRLNQVIVASSAEALQNRSPEVEATLSTLTGNWVAIPMTVSGRITGALGLSFAGPQDFNPADQEYMLTLAGQCAQALERARLYEAGQQARVKAETEVKVRRQTEEKLQVSLQEKEILLREVNHRVKNNLMAVSNLLYIQALHIQDPQMRQKFEETQNRIKSIALIHETLYQTENFTRINFTEYVETLARHLVHSYRVDPDLVRLTVTSDDAGLSVDTTVSLGIIVNELVSNALKHAFPGNRPGHIEVDLRHNDAGGLTLTVADDGVGFQEDMDLTTMTGSLGLQLVQMLVGHMGGTVALAQEGGARFTITVEPLAGAAQVR